MDEKELERLTKENNFLQLQLNAIRDLWAERDAALAQSNAEPVAWFIHDPSGFKFASVDKSGSHEYCAKRPAYRIEPLYTTPPRPDVSAELDGLRERCAEAQRLAFEWMKRHDKVVGFISKNYPAVMMPNLPFPSPVSRPDASAAADEIERLQLELDSTLGLLYQESERRAKAEHDLKRWQEVGWSRVKATPSSHS